MEGGDERERIDRSSAWGPAAAGSGKFLCAGGDGSPPGLWALGRRELWGRLARCPSCGCACGRRLRELCALTKRRKLSVTDSAGGVTAAALGRSLLCACGGNNTARKALLWGDLTGCFFPCGVDQRFRRLPRAGDFGGRCDVASELGGDAMDGGRKLSPVSVLELQSDEESPVPSHCKRTDSSPSTK